MLVNGEVVDEVDHLTYMGTKVSTSVDGEGLPKSQESWLAFEIRFFKSKVLSTLLYGAESWKMTNQPQARSLPEVSK